MTSWPRLDISVDVPILTTTQQLHLHSWSIFKAVSARKRTAEERENDHALASKEKHLQDMTNHQHYNFQGCMQDICMKVKLHHLRINSLQAKGEVSMCIGLCKIFYASCTIFLHPGIWQIIHTKVISCLGWFSIKSLLETELHQKLCRTSTSRSFNTFISVNVQKFHPKIHGTSRQSILRTLNHPAR